MSGNTHYGTAALNSNHGDNNTAIGAFNSYNNTSGYQNTSVGSNALLKNTSGADNTSIGSGSMCFNTTGTLNTAIGSSSLQGVTAKSVGNYNIAVGASALYKNTGNANVAVGTNSLDKMTMGSYNVAIGDDSGINCTTYNYNTLLGALTDIYVNGIKFSTAIGYGAVATESNTIMMGGPSPDFEGAYPTVVVPGNLKLQNLSFIDSLQVLGIDENGNVHTTNGGGGGGNVFDTITVNQTSTLKGKVSIGYDALPDTTNILDVAGNVEINANGTVIIKGINQTFSDSYKTLYYEPVSGEIGYQSTTPDPGDQPVRGTTLTISQSGTIAGGLRVGFSESIIVNYNIETERDILVNGIRVGTGPGLGISTNTVLGVDALNLNSGEGAGYNVAVGWNAGNTQFIYNYNTLLGALTDTTSPDVEYSTAIGYGAVVDTSNTIMLGGPNLDGVYPTVVVPGGFLEINNMFRFFDVDSPNIVEVYYDRSSDLLGFYSTPKSTTVSGVRLDITRDGFIGGGLTLGPDVETGVALDVSGGNVNINGTLILPNLVGSVTQIGTALGIDANGNVITINGGGGGYNNEFINIFVSAKGAFGYDSSVNVPPYSNTVDVSGNIVTTADCIINGVTVGVGGNNDSTNTLVGNQAFSINSSGEFNSIFGQFSLNSNTSGSSNCAFGQNSFPSNSNGSYNIGIGINSGLGNVSGSNNTYLGTSTGCNQDVNYATAIGSHAFVDTSNTIVLGGPCSNLGGAYPKVIIPGGELQLSGLAPPSGSPNYYLGVDVCGNVITAGGGGGYNQFNNINVSIKGSFGYASFVDVPPSGNSIDVSGNVDVVGTLSATQVTFTSDYRIKEDVQNLADSFVLDNLRPVTYKNKITQKQDIGLIAHEVQEEIPLLVNGEKDADDLQTINYIALIPILIKEIKDLKNRIKVLEGKE